MNYLKGLEIRWAQGFTNKTIGFVDSRTACYTCGNHICFLNMETKKQSVFKCPGRGVGALTTNSSRGIFAFSEQKLNPPIFVYSYPKLQLNSQLKGTAKLDYTCVTLSNDGPYLAAVSFLPDHCITVWNWETAELICAQPNAGKDIVSLVFNPLNWLQLCALGTTSLTVWNIEKSASFHVLKSRIVELSEDSIVGRPLLTIPTVTDKTPHGASVTPKTSIKARLLTPSAICWTASSELYVGCEEGFLFLVDPDSLSVSLLYNPKSADANPEIEKSGFNGLTLGKEGLISVGKEIVHCLEIKRMSINITQAWQLERPVTTAIFSPDNEILLLSSNTGQIYTLNTTHSDPVLKILDVLSGSFVTAAWLNSDICVSLRKPGELQLWSADGVCLSSLSLQTEVTSMACCPIAHYAAVGTSTGHVVFVDLSNEKQPRMVHRVHLYKTPVVHLVFDQGGHYLLSSASTSHLYVVNARPSKLFEVIGYTVFPGWILSLSTQYIRDSEQVKVLALCSDTESNRQDGSTLVLISLPARNIAGSDCVDRHGCLSSHIFKVSRYKVADALAFCGLGVDQVFAFCCRNNTIQRFLLHQDGESFPTQEVVHLTPEQEVEAHSAVTLALSPHGLWLASAGGDGLLQIRDISNMDQHVDLWCHSFRLGGVKSVSFSNDSLKVLTTGVNDHSLVCTNLRIKDMDAGHGNEDAQSSQAMTHTIESENLILSGLQVSPDDTTKLDAKTVIWAPCVDGSGNSPLHTSTSEPTWMESRTEAVIIEDNKHYAEKKKELMNTIQEIRNSIETLCRENPDLPEETFNLDDEWQNRLEAIAEQEAERVRKEIQSNIAEKRRCAEVLKRECWDSMKVKRRTLQAFHSGMEVQNYPLKERTEKELKDLHMVEKIRKLEMGVCNISSTQGDEHEGEGQKASSSVFTGSFSYNLGFSNPYMYDHFSVKTIEQRINQIILLQDLIYSLKMGFNGDFEVLHRQKVQELKRVKDKNRHIRELMIELNMEEELWEPSLTDREWPERLLTVDPSEIKAEKYLTPEQKKEEKKSEEPNQLAAQKDDPKARAWDDMMNAVLEVKKECILKMEIPQPDFALNKPDSDLSDKEKKVLKEYEIKVKDLNEKKEKYRNSVETEIKKLQESIMESTKRFDESLCELMERREQFEMAIKQEELRITNLQVSLCDDEEMRNQMQELKLQLKKTRAYQDEIEVEVNRHEDKVKQFHQDYDSIVAEDKVLDKEFRKYFSDVPNPVVDLLYKLFKRRPRALMMNTQTNTQCSLLEENRPRGSSSASDGRSKVLKAIKDLDAPVNMPEGLSPSIWERFCKIRRAKIESEHQVTLKALTLAEMQAFLQRRRDEQNAALQEIKDLNEAIERLHRERNQHLINTTVHLILKSGQVMVPQRDLMSDNKDIILVHRSVYDDLRKEIRVLEKKVIDNRMKRNAFLKNLKQEEWKNRVLRKTIEDLEEKQRDIRMFRLTHVNKTDLNNREKVRNLEKHLDLIEKVHQKKVQERIKKTELYKEQAVKITKENAALMEQLQKENMAVAQLRNILEVADSEENAASQRDERNQEVVQKKKLKDLSSAQGRELELLRAELQRLTERNFPSLDLLKHH
ncbi:cilia- and flagella-associated protein 43 isoform X2 [Gouania willdenowi]|uniref:cilia- and flagella-associated protein 43 isoform X2 n=1 Tax=Gouania willdenowi TaxID=441366 RepID=UPI001056A9BE|nr:cilia- and flagella-associated protein 43 isoform X2 [Gouania willdenowi]